MAEPQIVFLSGSHNQNIMTMMFKSFHEPKGLDAGFYLYLRLFKGYRSLGSGTSWSVGNSSSTYVGSSRDYDGNAWIPGVSASQGHGSHGLASSGWSSSRG